jgi:hypothetical protein
MGKHKADRAKQARESARWADRQAPPVNDPAVARPSRYPCARCGATFASPADLPEHHLDRHTGRTT